MPTNISETKDFELRLYDGTTPTPNYVRGIFLGDDFPDFTAPGGAAFAEEILIMDREQANNEMAYMSGSDRPTFTALGPYTFTWMFNSGAVEYIRAWGNPQLVTPWSIGGTTFLPVTDIGNRFNARGVSVPCPLPANANRRNYIVNAYLKLLAPPSGGNDYAQEMLGLSPNPETLEWAVDGASLRVTLQCLIFGGISEIADFPAGSEVIPN